MTAGRPPPTIPWVWKPDEPGAEPRVWDQEGADDLVGQYILVGVTYLGPDGKTVKSQSQYHGRIVTVDRETGVQIECEGAWAGHKMSLPPVLDCYFPAREGEYRLRSTGEVVKDPDLTTQWTSTEKSVS